MAKRRALTERELETAAGGELLALCKRLTEQVKLTAPDIRELVRWLRTNQNSSLPGKDCLKQALARLVGDRQISWEDERELRKAIESVMPPKVRKIAVQRRKDVKQAEFERAQVESGVVLLTAKDGQKYPLHSLVGAVEYGRDTLQQIAERLGPDVAATVEQNVRARERQLTGHIVKETDGGAWVFRLAQGGDYIMPISATRILSGMPPGPLTIAVAGSFAADLDRQRPGRNLVFFSTLEVAQRFNVSVDTVRKWIRDGQLAADSVSNGSAAFEYRIAEDELTRFASQFIGRS
jgi:excisionase family DNA binding protein